MTDDRRSWMGVGDETDIQLTEYDITSAPNDFNVLTICNFIEKGSILLPPYQRNYTWDKTRASKLIESLILGLPVPQLFLYEEAKNKFAILDGQQRLLSIYFFVKQRFPQKPQRMALREIFAETGIFPTNVLADNNYFQQFNIYLPAAGGEEKNPLHGLNYETLPSHHRLAFDLRTVRCVIIKQNEPKDDNSSVYEIFDRLNTGGVNLKPQEIRANLYYSDFYKFLYEANKDKRWRRILGQQDRDDKLRDVELLLRAFAMLCYATEYRPSMTRFLNRFSNHAKKNFDCDKIVILKQILEAFLTSTKDIDPAVFKLNERFSIAVFEAALYGKYASAWTGETSIDAIPPIQEAQIADLARDLRTKLQEGTSKREHVNKRLEIAINILSR
ncbi:MAG: DUF262 domain-containing protein [Rhodomicrobium sp.]